MTVIINRGFYTRFQPHNGSLGRFFHCGISHKSNSLIEPGDIFRGISNRFEGKQVVSQKHGSRINLVVSSIESMIATQYVILAPMSSFKMGKERYRYEVVINPDESNNLIKISKVMTNQLFSSAISSFETAQKIGSVSGSDFERVKTGIAVAFAPMETKQINTPPFKRGDIVQILKNGIEEEGIVVSNDVGNFYAPLIMFTFFTDCEHESYESDILVRTNQQKQICVKYYNIYSIDKEYITKKVDEISEFEMAKITERIYSMMKITE